MAARTDREARSQGSGLSDVRNGRAGLSAEGAEQRDMLGTHGLSKRATEEELALAQTLRQVIHLHWFIAYKRGVGLRNCLGLGKRAQETGVHKHWFSDYWVSWAGRQAGRHHVMSGGGPVWREGLRQWPHGQAHVAQIRPGGPAAPRSRAGMFLLRHHGALLSAARGVAGC